MPHIDRSTFIMLTLLVITAACLAFNNLANQNGKIYIWNTSGQSYDIDYFSDENGKWINVSDVVPKNDLTEVRITKNSLTKAANFNIRVGKNVDAFYCSTDIQMKSFHSNIDLANQKGNCSTLKFNDHEVALIIK